MSFTEIINLLHFQMPLPWLLLSLITWAALVALGAFLTPRPMLWLHVARWVLVPYLGILAGGISPSLMGLTNIDWLVSLGVGIALFLSMVIAMLVVRLALNWALSEQGTARSEAKPTWANLPETDRGTRALRPLIDGAEQFHWSFLRAGIWEIALVASFALSLPAYWSISLATAVVVPEILLQRLGFLATLMKLTILIMTAVLFFYTRNFWLCWLLHALSTRLLNLTSQSSRQVLAPRKISQL